MSRQCQRSGLRFRTGRLDLNDIWDFISNRRSQLVTDSYLHVSAVIQCVLLATVIGVVVGVAVYRSPAGSALATALSSAILTVPSFALLGLLIPLFGLGVVPTVIALTLYSLLPIIRNTIVGLAAVDPAITDAAKGIGMNPWRVLGRIELVLAWPSILTGMRVSTQLAMGILAIAAYAKGPGLGNLIFSGLSRIGSPTAVPQALVGTVLVVILALILDAIYVVIGKLTTSKGIRD
ncbi:osmoprotectant transport system permease protein [Williamsia sterculiae]|uniref:Osmoprotectant transport system permease protein n=1 Tax=Williamsia sterculiae TaxID=1344003 RepID=A0A1N7G9U5_9NOCA|nr:osmoprotectant transport system permease protein [Williamsia sterculiae]